MIQLLLVDDEPMLLKSMVENDWRSIGVEYVFQAASGLEAVEVLKKTPIDIVVTDIRMPGMNGLQLCKHIQDHFPVPNAFYYRATVNSSTRVRRLCTAR